MDADHLLDLFDSLVARTIVELDRLDDWGLSGQRSTQYHHDVVADGVIVPGLRAAGLAVLSEESGLVGEGGAGAIDGVGEVGGVGETDSVGGDAGVGGVAGVTVVVDPVDGSTNASRGVPWWAVSLCAVDGDGPLAALVVNLATGCRYRAVRGRGARRDRSPLRLGGSSALAAGVGAGVEVGVGVGVGVGIPFDEAEAVHPSGVERLGEAIIGFSGYPPARAGWRQFRVLGAAALDLCAVADGTLDGYVDVDRAHGVWDYLGALLVCREAGVGVVDWADEELVVLDPDARRGPVAGATPELTSSLLTMVSSWG